MRLHRPTHPAHRPLQVAHRPRRLSGTARALRGAWLLALLTGCALAPPAPGTARADVVARWGRPTAVYALDGGVERLEYATGPYGRTTWMVDVDAAGSVLRARQVLNEADFLRVQSAAGLTRAELLRWLGTPGERKGGGWAGGEVWSWRYPTNDCLWFQSSIDDHGRVTGSTFGIDPACDAHDANS